MNRTIILSASLIASLSFIFFALPQLNAESGIKLTEDASANIVALGQDEIPDCSYIRTETHCVFKRTEYTDTIIKGKRTRISSVNEIPYMNMAVSCKPGGTSSCKNITCDDLWEMIKQVDPDAIYMKQPKSQKYFNKFLRKPKRQTSN